MTMNFNKRREMISLLREMCSPDLQRHLWIEKKDYPNASGIDEVFHFLFDDTNLGSDPESEVGNFLESTEEASRIALICRGLEVMLNRLGNVDSEAYLDDPQWASIAKLAESALQVTAIGIIDESKIKGLAPPAG